MPFLAAHQCGPRTYSIGGTLYPISLRDQIVRATAVVERAFEAGFISPSARDPLLVVGAGLGGVAAAVWSARRSIRTVLIEQQQDALELQQGCKTRYISPTQYDWPAEHWFRGQYPWDSPITVPPSTHPLFWQSGYADQLALAWRARLHQEVNKPKSFLTFRPRTTLTGAPVHANSSPSVEPSLFDQRSGVQYKFSAQAIVLAFGFGAERVYLDSSHPTRGVRFWCTDRFAHPRMGLDPTVVPEIVISGSGDGALQDFIRICTQENDIAVLYERIVPDAYRATLAGLVRDAQERFQRAYIWGRNDAHDHILLQRLHEKYEGAVSAALADPTYGPTIWNNLQTIVRPPGRVRLVHSCTHFTNCYGLNRLLVLLIARYMASTSEEPVLISQRRLLEVAGSNGHRCCGSADTGPDCCYGASHELTLCEHADCRDQPAGVAAETWSSVNVLVIRHGVDQSPTSWRLSPPSSRQLLPYDFPY